MALKLGVGDVMPDLPLERPEGGSIRPSDYAGRRLVVFFYPKDDTPGCTVEAKDFSRLRTDFEALDTALLGVSKDNPRKHLAFIEKHGLAVDLATDAAEGGLSDALGIWTEKKMYGRTFMGMVRTTILVGHDGRIERVWNKVKPAGHAEAVLNAVREAQAANP